MLSKRAADECVVNGTACPWGICASRVQYDSLLVLSITDVTLLLRLYGGISEMKSVVMSLTNLFHLGMRKNHCWLSRILCFIYSIAIKQSNSLHHNRLLWMFTGRQWEQKQKKQIKQTRIYIHWLRQDDSCVWPIVDRSTWPTLCCTRLEDLYRRYHRWWISDICASNMTHIAWSFQVLCEVCNKYAFLHFVNYFKQSAWKLFLK